MSSSRGREVVVTGANLSPMDDNHGAGAPALGGYEAMGYGTAGTLIERLGIEFEEATAERVAAWMPVAGNTQPAGLLHGGASVALAETLGSVASQYHAGPEASVVGLEINATHHRAVRSGRVHGVAIPIHRGRSTTSYEIVITDDSGRRVCTARLSCLILR